MTTPAPRRPRYHLRLIPTFYRRTYTEDGPDSVPVVLDDVDVLGWVAGFAAALNESHHLNVIDQHAPEDTRRVQALQIGDARGWFVYLYPEYPTRTES